MRERTAPQKPLKDGVTWVSEALSIVRSYRETLNSMNAFPVPDHDTGSNLVHTLHALDEAFMQGLGELLQQIRTEHPDAQTLHERLGKLYENAFAQASRHARGNSGTLLCAWGLEAVRAYWSLPGSLAYELGEKAEELELVQALHGPQQRPENHYPDTVKSDAEKIESESAYRASYALALAAERVRRIVADESLVRGTMVALMMALADERFHKVSVPAAHDEEQSSDMGSYDQSSYRREAMVRALKGTAQHPPKPELAGHVDAGALGFYLAVVHSNPLWRTSRLSPQDLEDLIRPSQGKEELESTPSTAQNAAAWELMGTLTAEPLALAQLRVELDKIGDSLLLTPLKVEQGTWALHIHVSSLDDARETIARYGTLEDERISSLTADSGDTKQHTCQREF